ncbi:SMI1/KNR4 family protein [Streptomyces sp. NPDC020192]|uniref:SMI1/KNR4 family protein n=1 Tax=Streptomyces sp. NPDC020192 TaxID=3365066 RepID=UPI0037877D65
MNDDQVDPGELAALRAAFGVDDDGGASALGWEGARAFEARHGVTLPEPYRSFVAEVTDGSAQGPPHYGLSGLARAAASQDPDKPFPLTKAWVWEEDDGPYEDPDTVIEQVAHHGSLVLGTDGCGMDWHLIVTGPHRGHIWQITGEGAVPFGAEFGCTSARPGFAGWVRHWADCKEWFDGTAA